MIDHEIYLTIGSLESGKTYEQIFLITKIEHNPKMKTGQGKPFARVQLKDVTGEINGVIWGYGENDNELMEGSYAMIKLETKLYRSELEFCAQITDIELVETPINKHDYVKGVGDNILRCYADEIHEEISSISDPIYRDIIGNAMQRLGFMASLKESPYGITGPMAYKGGLMVHVANSLRFAKIAVRQATDIDVPFSQSLVIAGCLLRNIGWHTCTQFQGDRLRFRDAYYMTGIHRASARYIDHLMLTCENDLQIKIPEGKRQALENMCNKKDDIITLEGKIVSCADNLADVLDFSVASLQRKQTGSWNGELFTGHI